MSNNRALTDSAKLVRMALALNCIAHMESIDGAISDAAKVLAEKALRECGLWDELEADRG